MTKLLFYTTLGCHLCEHAETMLLKLQAEQRQQFESVDISSDEKLVELYGIRIPVVKNPDTGKEIGWPFDESELLGLL